MTTRTALLFAVCTLVCISADAQLVISEFRWHGTNGTKDEFIEIANNSHSSFVVSTSDGSSGFAVVASDGVTRFTIPNGTTIPARGHYLGCNSVGYSQSAYPGGICDATYTADIPLNAGIALFRTATPANFTLANRLDAVGSAAEANTLYREGTGVRNLHSYSVAYSYVRRLTGGCLGTHPGIADSDCTNPTAIAGTAPAAHTFLKDTSSNRSDFYFQDTNGTSASPEASQQRLGGPGPQNLNSHVGTGSLLIAAVDACVPLSSPPNQVYDLNSIANGVFGSLNIRRKITNNSGGNISRLRFRIHSITTFPSGVFFLPPSPNDFCGETGSRCAADLRPLTSETSTVSISASCGGATPTLEGTELEQAPAPEDQPNGGGFNSSFGADTISLSTPLAPGASIFLNFRFGVQQRGYFRIDMAAEAWPTGGSAPFSIQGCLGDGCYRGTGDFNGDAKSDILLRNSSTGEIAEWQMNGTAITAAAVIASPGTAYTLATAGDLSGEKLQDVVLRNSAGDVAAWLMSGTAIVGAGIAGAPGSAWLPVGSGDTDGDGRADLVMRNSSTGEIAIWQMVGTTIMSAAVIASPGTAFNVAAVRDFDGDARADLILQNASTGEVAQWRLNGFLIAYGALIASPGAAWQVKAAGDFNGDGKSDLVLRNSSTGEVAQWQMNGATITGGAVFASPSTAYDVAASGDYNGDGRSDLLLRNTSGTLAMWLMNGFTITTGAAIATPGTAWVPLGK